MLSMLMQLELPFGEFTILAVFLIVVVVAILISGVVIIQPWQQGLWIVLGQYKKRLSPGFHWVYPLISRVQKLELRTQVLDVPRQEVITKDNSPTNVDAIVYIRVVDPEKAFFEVTDYHIATIALSQTTLRSQIGEMELNEILSARERINSRLRDILDEATDAWGVKVEAVEIREVDPVARVKQAMEDQTSAERERRAAILRSDGEKKSSILVAEGARRARILEAEGLRQAKILEAEGTRRAKILEAQGEAQGLRLLAVGAVPLDRKALTVLSLDTLAKMANGQSTKIIFPFEISKLIEQTARYIGLTTALDTERGDVREVDKIVGKASDVLGNIPKPDEYGADLQSIETELDEELRRTGTFQVDEKAETKPKLGGKG